MTILPHADNIQDNGYFCGPATEQVLLGIRKVPVSESQLAQELGTTVNGTPSVDDLVRVLNARLGPGTYRSVWIGGNSASAEQVAQLRADVTAAIGAGYGVGCNVVGRATTADGREVNSYQGGHYLPITGITDDTGLPWCTDVADGHEYTMTWQALGDWIAGRGYATITAATAAQSTVEGNMGWQRMKYGEQSDAIRDVQHQLRDAGADIEVTGKFDDPTAAAIVKLGLTGGDTTGHTLGDTEQARLRDLVIAAVIKRTPPPAPAPVDPETLAAAVRAEVAAQLAKVRATTSLALAE